MAELVSCETSGSAGGVHAIDPYSHEFLSNPFADLKRLREAAPAVYLEQYGIWAVARYRDVDAILRDHETFSSESGTGIDDLKKSSWRGASILLESDPPIHTVNRRAVNRAVAPSALKALRVMFEERADSLVEKLITKRQFDAVSELAEVFPAEVFPEAFGLKDKNKDMLLAFESMVFNGWGPRNDLFEAAMMRAAEVTNWVHQQCSRAALTDDGLGARIYSAVSAGEITEENADLLVRSFLAAGVDTTINGIALAIGAFVRNPDQWELLRRYPDLARSAFDEALRLESPVIGFFRTTTCPTTIDGVDILANAKVLVLFAGANRDPDRWERPDDFDIKRKAVGHVAFGMGVHSCVGQAIARLEAEVLFKALAARIRTWTLVGEPKPRLCNTLRGYSHLPVEVQPG
ncbi:cytochrome P450 [Mycobacterium sp. E796]|uniref:cytochrome P450 n=1 Tax=Mycobacterium sp. E796 TaxID=1834151 RepID=UPI0018D28D6E|nr:cytochrome P450 [Mycobacterium sp. E796]